MAARIYDFVQKLAKRTAEGRLNWERTETDGEYQASFPSYSVRILVRETAAQNSEDVAVQIFGEDGALVEDFTDVDVALASENMMNGQQAFRFMSQLHKDARRKAMGVDKALDDLMKSLGDDDVPF